MLQRAVRICIAEAGSATLDDVVSYLRDKACTYSAYFLRNSNNQDMKIWCLGAGACRPSIWCKASAVAARAIVVIELAPSSRHHWRVSAELQTCHLWWPCERLQAAAWQRACHTGKLPDRLPASSAASHRHGAPHRRRADGAGLRYVGIGSPLT